MSMITNDKKKTKINGKLCIRIFPGLGEKNISSKTALRVIICTNIKKKKKNNNNNNNNKHY
jgi:hypothetical protein